MESHFSHAIRTVLFLRRGQWGRASTVAIVHMLIHRVLMVTGGDTRHMIAPVSTPFNSVIIPRQKSLVKVNLLDAQRKQCSTVIPARLGGSFFSFTRFSRVDYSAGATYSYQQVDARTAWVGTPDYYLPLSNAAAGILRMEGRMSGVLF